MTTHHEHAAPTGSPPIDGLFPEPARTTPDTPPAFTPGQRRRHRQIMATQLGSHPLSLALRTPIPLHPAAAPALPRDADGLRCGSCRWRQQVGHHTRAYAKCLHGAVQRSRTDADGKTWRWLDYPRVTHGEGTDCATWWPACADWEPRP